MLDTEKKALVAISDTAELDMLPGMANRHGLITGATGTGKTVTLQTLAETFSELGVPVFAADVKGDLSGVAAPGGGKESITKRVDDFHLADKGFRFRKFPVQFWDVFGEQGTPVRATVTGMGPMLLGRLLTLNDTQSDVLTIVFKIASDNSWELVDLKDLQKVLQYIGDNKSAFMPQYGNISTASLGAIQRGLIALEHDGAGHFFGEPSLDIDDLIQTEGDMGVINILAADRLMASPRLYSTVLLWLMTAIYNNLPEVGDPEKPRLVFFFDEAHLLFNDSPKVLVDTIEQVVRLIRSKGVGIYFISQTPADIPDSILGQLGNRIQHALRAYTPRDRKALKVAAQSFRTNPAFDTETAISELGTGEALVSLLDSKGAPRPVERACILPPEGQVGPLAADRREAMVRGSLLDRHYSRAEDGETAYEILTEKMANTVSGKELAKRRQEEARQAKEEERRRREQERVERREAEQQKRFWRRLIASLMPLLRQLVMLFAKGGNKR